MFPVYSVGQAKRECYGMLARTMQTPLPLSSLHDGATLATTPDAGLWTSHPGHITQKGHAKQEPQRCLTWNPLNPLFCQPPPHFISPNSCSAEPVYVNSAPETFWLVPFLWQYSLLSMCLLCPRYVRVWDRGRIIAIRAIKAHFVGDTMIQQDIHICGPRCREYSQRMTFIYELLLELPQAQSATSSKVMSLLRYPLFSDRWP